MADRMTEADLWRRYRAAMPAVDNELDGLDLPAYVDEEGDEAALSEIEAALARDLSAIDGLIAVRSIQANPPPTPLGLVRWAAGANAPWNARAGVAARPIPRGPLWLGAIAASFAIVCSAGFVAGAMSAAPARNAEAREAGLVQALGPTFNFAEADNDQFD